MGDIGPCGPCSEIFYDHGESVPGGPPGSPDEDGDRYIEIWNLVFMQFNKDKNGELHPLPAPSVDTGMGLERIAAVLQGVHSNYEIDLFKNLIEVAAQLTDTKDLTHSSLRVIADHIRSCAFMIVDGVLPSNEGRGYVLRRIIRRAIRHGYRLGCKTVFFHQLVAPLVQEMGSAFPELETSQNQVERVLKIEEERFAETLDQGMKILETSIVDLGGSVIPGNTAFLLYDTYGFPVDLTADFAREHGLTVDQAGFETEMAAQRDRARSGGKFKANYDQDIDYDAQTEFTGYHQLVDNGQIKALYRQGESVNSLQVDEEGVVILDHTPFYAESGGQVGDKGQIIVDNSVFSVENTQKQANGLFLHQGKVVSGSIQKGQNADLEVSSAERTAITLNHSATHLMHAALREILGEHVSQKGSLVNAERLRFDFSHFEPLSSDEIYSIEALVNEQIRLNSPVAAEIMAKDEAVKAGAMALFGEKYGDQVRVLRIGEFSTELCGGTHVQRSGDIGCFKIISETGVASGVRRIEALTGKGCFEWLNCREKSLENIASLVKSNIENAADKVYQLAEKNKQLEKELEKLKSKLASAAGGELSEQAVDVKGIKVLAVKLEDADPKGLRDMADQLKNKLGTAAIVLAAVNSGKVSLIASISKDLTKTIKAGDLVNLVAIKVGGKGGGRPDMAQAGGNKPEQLDDALKCVPAWVTEQLG